MQLNTNVQMTSVDGRMKVQTAYGSLDVEETKANVLAFGSTKLLELKKIAEEGDVNWKRAGSIAAGLIIWVSIFNFFYHLSSLSPFTAVEDVYMLAGGVVAAMLEIKPSFIPDHYFAKLKKEALFLYKPYGKAGFYIAIGVMLACESTFSLTGLVGLFTTFVGVIIFIGSRAAEKAHEEMRAQNAQADEAEITKRFHAADKGRTGKLESKEIFALCQSLGTSLTKSELEGALLAMDNDHR